MAEYQSEAFEDFGGAASEAIEHLRQPYEQAYWLLRAGFTAAPILAGMDKFSQRMTNWDQYLAPGLKRMSPFSTRTFMKLVGVTEIAAGTLVAMKPSIGSYVVAGWLGGIMGNLMAHPKRYGDISMRDFGLMLGALALARLESGRSYYAEQYAQPSSDSRKFSEKQYSQRQRQYAPSQPSSRAHSRSPSPH